MHYILLKGSDDQSRIAVIQELKRLRKRVKELEEQLEEVQGQYDYECECNKQFVACQKENEKLKQQLEIFKLSNEALQQDNLDLSYDKADLAYEYAQEMAENWKKGYEEEIAELKNQQNEKAIQELEQIAKKLKVVPKPFDVYNGWLSPICKTYLISDDGVKPNKKGRKIIKAGSPLLKTEILEKDELLVGASSDKIFGNPDIIGFTRYDMDVSDGKVVATCRCMDYADQISLFIDHVNTRLKKFKGENNENI